MKKITILVCGLLCAAVISAQGPWEIGAPNVANVVATLNGSVLSISGTGAMMNFAADGADAPWLSARGSINNIIIGQGISGIGENAFYGFTTLSNIEVTRTTPPTIISNVFGGISSNVLENVNVFVPQESTGTYESHGVWGSFNFNFQAFTRTITITTQPAASTNVWIGVTPLNTLSVAASVTNNVTLYYQWFHNSTNSNTGGTAIVGATSASFSIPNNLAQGNHYYYCEVTASRAMPVRSNVAIAVAAVPVITITKQPTNQDNQDNLIFTVTNFPHSESELSIGATLSSSQPNGTGVLLYQWFKNLVPNNTGGESITVQMHENPSYRIDNLTVGTHYFYCVLTAEGAETVRSELVTVNVIVPVITITAHPTRESTFKVGAIHGDLNVTASINLPQQFPTYQWYSHWAQSTQGGNIIDNATSSTYTLPATGLSPGDYYYYCVINGTNGAESVTSNWAKVTIEPAEFQIIQQPQQVTDVQVGTSGLLQIIVNSAPDISPRYRWFINTIDSYEGATPIGGYIPGSNSNLISTSTYQTPDNLEPGTYYYFCEISDHDGWSDHTLSSIATVHVNSSVIFIAPAQQPTPITNVPMGSISGVLSVRATITPNMEQELGFQWFSNSTGGNTDGVIIEGATSPNFTIPADLKIGTYFYFCEVSSEGARSVRSNAARVTVTDPIVSITTQPAQSTEVMEGVITASLSVEASVASGVILNYQWFSNTINSYLGSVPVLGAISSEMDIPTDLTVGTYYFYCEINAEGAIPVRTEIARVQVRMRVITYTVTFETFGGSEIPEEIITPGDRVTRPSSPTRTGYSFGGWHVDEEWTQVWNFSDIVTEDITLYARWIPVSVNTEELFSEEIKIYPNPFSSEVRITGIDADTQRPAHLLVVNPAGATVHTYLITSPEETISLEWLPAGVYMFRLENNANVQTVRVVKN